MWNRYITVQELERLVRPKKRLLHQEWLEPVDHTVDSINYVYSTIKDPVIVEADKKPVRWLSDFISE